MQDSIKIPLRFSQIPIFHSADKLLSNLSLPKFQGHSCICNMRVKTERKPGIGSENGKNEQVQG